MLRYEIILVDIVSTFPKARSFRSRVGKDTEGKQGKRQQQST